MFKLGHVWRVDTRHWWENWTSGMMLGFQRIITVRWLLQGDRISYPRLLHELIDPNILDNGTMICWHKRSGQLTWRGYGWSQFLFFLFLFDKKVDNCLHYIFQTNKDRVWEYNNHMTKGEREKKEGKRRTKQKNQQRRYLTKVYLPTEVTATEASLC